MEVEILAFAGGKKFQIVLWIIVQEATEAENKVCSSFLDIALPWWYLASLEFIILIDIAKKIFSISLKSLFLLKKMLNSV